MQVHPFGGPLVAAYFGGDLARELEAAGLAAMAAFAEDELSAAHGTRLRGSFTQKAASGWMADPLAGGAYPYPRPRATAARAALASSLAGRPQFAREAKAQDFPPPHPHPPPDITAACMETRCAGRIWGLKTTTRKAP